jgi:neurotransmitter:Na+ symporter, NSS family
MNDNRWSSHFNFILAATGAAVGLGSIWKFPYMTGSNGGGVFVLLFLLAVIFIAVPVMIGEILLGKIARADPVNAMQNLAKKYGKTKYWGLLGWWGLLSLILILAFYSVIAGWSIAYTYKTWSLQLVNLNQQELSNEWLNFLDSPGKLLIWHSMFMVMTLVVVAHGINRGLERASQIMMPGLLLVLCTLLVYSCIVGDMAKTLHFLFYLDFSKLTADTAIAALGQAAFSLATGAGCMLVYGCYLSSNSKICTNVNIIAILVVLVSLLSGLAILPLVFAYGLEPTGGPSLMFQVLPIAFNQMPFGTFFGGLFFIMLLFAAWTSSISMAEPLVVLLIEKFNFSRNKSAIIIGSICWIVGILALLSFNILKNIQIFGKYDIFSAIADFATNIILPTGALGFAIFAGWIIPDKIAKQELNINSCLAFKLWQFLTKYIAPIGIIVIFI